MKRRPIARRVEEYRAALAKYHGVPPLALWRRYNLRTRAAAIYRWRHNGRDCPVDELPH